MMAAASPNGLPMPNTTANGKYAAGKGAKGNKKDKNAKWWRRNRFWVFAILFSISVGIMWV